MIRQRSPRHDEKDSEVFLTPSILLTLPCTQPQPQVAKLAEEGAGKVSEMVVCGEIRNNPVAKCPDGQERTQHDCMEQRHREMEVEGDRFSTPAFRAEGKNTQMYCGPSAVVRYSQSSYSGQVRWV